MALIGRKERFTATTKVVVERNAIPPTTSPNSGVANLPRMVQVAGDLEFEFPFGLNNFSHDVGAVQFDELARPLQLPILQPTAGSLQKVSFDFLVAKHLDGVRNPVDDELANLQNFAAEDNSVIFINVHQMMGGSVASWKIQSMSVQVTRVNELGQTVSAQVSMSCTESSDTLERFLTLPKFTYRDKKQGVTGKPGEPQGPGNAHRVIEKFFKSLKNGFALEEGESVGEYIASLNRLSAQYGGESNVRDILLKTAGNKATWTASSLFNALVRDLKDQKDYKAVEKK